jgi:hypothetical protein
MSNRKERRLTQYDTSLDAPVAEMGLFPAKPGARCGVRYDGCDDCPDAPIVVLRVHLANGRWQNLPLCAVHEEYIDPIAANIIREYLAAAN